MNRRPLLLALGCALLATALLTSTLLAQLPTGTLSGRVNSADGALPGVTVTVDSIALQGTRTAMTTANGDYIFKLLPPGEYEVSFELDGFETSRQAVKVSAQQQAEVSPTLAVSGVTEAIVVTSTHETISGTSQSSSTYETTFIEELPVNRDIRGTVTLAAGVSTTGPNGNISMSGGQSYENLFLVNGVVITENLRGQPFDLFIEDAIDETTTSVSGISAQYGRFAGGVVNTITKSGGNSVHGSLRTNLTNDDWSASTPLTVAKTDEINESYEATLGGFVLKDHLWYFLAGRDLDQTTTSQTLITAVPYPRGTQETRIEGKLTLSPTPSHRLTGTYFDIDEKDLGNSFGSILDTLSINDRELPQELKALNYTGVLSQNFFVEAQYSERAFAFVNSGSKFTDRIGGTLFVDRPTGRRWHSPTFCGVCRPEERDNENLLLKGSWFLSTSNLGAHDFVFGYDTFTDIRAADNHQSGSDFRILLSNTIIRGTDLYPVILPGGDTRIQWNPILVSSLGTDFKTNSFFANDRWRLNDKWSFNLGVRYDENDGVDSAGQAVAKDSKVSPRLGLSFDPKGDGDWSFHASLGRYVTAIANTQANATSQGGNPANITWNYNGPAINQNASGALVSADVALQRLWDWFDSVGNTNNTQFIRSISIPGGTTVIGGGSLDSPNTDEITVGFSKRLASRGIVRVDLVHREGADFYADLRNLSTGAVTTPNGSRADLSVIVNEDNQLERTYDGLHTQFQYRITDRINLGGTYTLSKSEGNWDGETGGSGPVRSGILQYPEYHNPSFTAPIGDLGIDQRHRLRLWGNWDVFSGEHQRLNIGVLQTFESGLPYEAVGSVDTRPYVTNPGYVIPPASVTYFFSDRGAFRTDDLTETSLSINYSLKFGAFGKSFEIFVQPEVINVFNEDGLDSVDTTVFGPTNAGTSCGGARCQAFNPFTTTPVEGVNWARGPDFGKAVGEGSFQQPRTFRLSVGFRF